MADAEGLLGQQLSAATQIPYENIKSNQTSLEMGLNAWSTATQIKLKRNELEGRMAQLAEKNRQLEMKGELDQQKFQLSAMMDHARMNHMADMTELAYGKLGFAKDQAGKREQDNAGLYNYFSSLDSEMGTPEWEKDATKGFAMFPNASATTRNVIARRVWPQHQDAFDQKTKALDAEEKNIRHNLSYDLFGVGNKGDVSVLEDRNRFVQNYATNKEGDSVGVAKGQIDKETGRPYELYVDPKTGGYAPTGYQSFVFVDPNDTERQQQYKPIATQRLDDYTKSLKANREARAKYGDRPHNPEAGVTRNEPTDYDIESLKKHPELKRRFEAHFGDGSAAPYLQQSTDD